MSASHRMTRRQLVDFLRSPLAIHEEFWVCMSTCHIAGLSELFLNATFSFCHLVDSVRLRQHRAFRRHPVIQNKLLCHIKNMKLVHWPLMGGLLHLVQRGLPGQARAPPRQSSLYQM